VRRDAGGSRVNTAVGYGLTGALFVLGWTVLGIMLLLRELFGGPAPQPQPEAMREGAAR
jgi:hypothetical protein